MKSHIYILLSFICFSSTAQTTKWQSLQLSLDGGVNSIYHDTANKAIYFAGDFQHVNGHDCNVVKWDGERATLLPAYEPTTAIGSLMVYKGMLYANGSRGVAHFDGKLWHYQDTVSRLVYHLNMTYTVPYGDKLLVTGSMYDTLSLESTENVFLFDGTSYTDLYQIDTLLGHRSGWGVQCIAVYNGEVYIGGNINPSGKDRFSEIARFDGHNWQDVGGGIPTASMGDVRGMLAWKGDLYVWGSFQESSGAPGNCIARWDGRAWHRLGSGKPSRPFTAIQQVALYHDKLYVVGWFEEMDGIPAKQLARWDGSKWCSVDNSLGDDDYGQALSIGMLNDTLYVGGSFYTAGGDSSVSRIARWAGGDHADSCAIPTSVSAPTGGQHEILLYPNPANSRVYIQTDRQILSVELLDPTGRKLSESMNYSPQNGISLRGIPPGLCIVRIRLQDGITTRRLVIR